MLLLSHKQFLYASNAPDPGADHGGLGPSGHISKRSRNALQARSDQQYALLREFDTAYQYLIDTGLFVDPEWGWLPTPDPRLKEIESKRHAIASVQRFVDRGYRVRYYTKHIGQWQEEIAGLEKEMETPNGLTQPLVPDYR